VKCNGSLKKKRKIIGEGNLVCVVELGRFLSLLWLEQQQHSHEPTSWTCLQISLFFFFFSNMSVQLVPTLGTWAVKREAIFKLFRCKVKKKVTGKKKKKLK
jgi:hypothetical protein